MTDVIQLTLTPEEAAVIAYNCAKGAQLLAGQPVTPGLEKMQVLAAAVAPDVDPFEMAGKITNLFNAAFAQLEARHGLT